MIKLIREERAIFHSLYKCVYVCSVIPDLVIISMLGYKEGWHSIFCLADMPVELRIAYLVHALGEEDFSSQDIKFIAPAVFIGQLDQAIQRFCVGVGN